MKIRLIINNDHDGVLVVSLVDLLLSSFFSFFFNDDLATYSCAQQTSKNFCRRRVLSPSDYDRRGIMGHTVFMNVVQQPLFRSSFVSGLVALRHYQDAKIDVDVAGAFDAQTSGAFRAIVSLRHCVIITGTYW